MKKCTLVGWPEIQEVVNHPRWSEWSECIFYAKIEGHECPDWTYMVPEDIYKEVFG